MEDFIRVYDQGLSLDLCAQIRQKFSANQNKYAGHAGQTVDKNFKDSQDLNITNLPDWPAMNEQITHAVFTCLIQYMKEFPFMLVGANTPLFRHPESGETEKLVYENFAEFGEPYIDTLIAQTYRLGQLNVQQYAQGKGGYHHWHSEICANDAQCETLHRALFFIIYLNDVTEGGETEFFYQKKTVKPQTGRIIIAPTSFTHTHKGHIPLSGNKTIVTSWVMFNRAG